MPSTRIPCQINSMNQQQNGRQKISDTLPRKGLVTEVCKEWLVREDGALAYELQKEEVERHYNSNKSRNAIVREDFPMAMDAQKKAEEEAYAEHQRQVLLLEERDALIARDIAIQLEREENEKRKILLEEDMKMAKIFQDKEERQVSSRIVGDINKIGLPLPPSLIDEVPSQSVRKLDKLNMIEEKMRKLHVSDSLLQQSSSSNDWPPPPPLDIIDDEITEQINRVEQEKSDEELAKRLQEEEEKLSRTMGMIDRDRLLAIEVQDMELAKMMQAKEKAKIKRAKERARARKQVVEEESAAAAAHPMAVYGPPPPTMTPTNESASAALHEPPLYRVPNIAMAIDPTYSPKFTGNIQQYHSQQPSLVQHSPQHTLLHHHTGDTTAADLNQLEDLPLFMPVQGQRRTSSGTDKKKKKEKTIL